VKSQAIVIGAGGHARVVGAALCALGVEISGFFDESFAGVEEPICGAPLIGTLGDVFKFEAHSYDAYVAIGDNEKRAEVIEKMRHAGYALPALIHPMSRLELDCRVGEASHVCIGAILGSQVRVGKGVIVNTGSSVDHESELSDFAHVAPGAILGGRVRVGEAAFIGIGARIAEKLSIGRGAVVGAGTVVLRDGADGVRVVGIHH
jgi:sugar O-acyltransferase (sialic acid O-acetyltransferase NeuD family)